MKRFSRILMAVGILLVLSAVALFGYNLLESKQAERAAAATMVMLRKAINSPAAAPLTRPDLKSDIDETEACEQQEPSTDETDPDTSLPSTEMTVVVVGGYGYIGYLTLPKLDLELPVMAECDYSRLKTAPCRFSGSTKTDNLVIAAHNYSSHFGSLKKLTVGDTLTFTDMDGVVTSYTVSEVTTLQPTQVDEMTDSGCPLTLFTCTVGGKARTTIRCIYTED